MFTTANPSIPHTHFLDRNPKFDTGRTPYIHTVVANKIFSEQSYKQTLQTYTYLANEGSEELARRDLILCAAA